MTAPFTYNPFDDASGQQFLSWLSAHNGLPSFNSGVAGAIGVKFTHQSVDLVAQQDGGGAVLLTNFLVPEVGAIPLFFTAVVTENIRNTDNTFPGLYFRVANNAFLEFVSDLDTGRILTITDSDNIGTNKNVPLFSALTQNFPQFDLTIATEDTLFASGKLKLGLWYLGLL